MKYLLTNQQSPRLKFRNLEPSDYDDWFELFHDDHTAAMLALAEFKTPKARCDKWFEGTFDRYEKDLGGQNVMVLKETGQMVGQAGLLVREIEDQFELEIAYSILPQYRQQGLAYEAAKKCKDFAFENGFHDRLVSLIFPENANSKKVALKNGMKFKREVIFREMKLELFQITKDEWRENS